VTPLFDPIPKLADYRLTFGLSLADVAEQLGTAVARIEAIEAGKAAPNDAEKRALCAVFVIDVNELDRALRVTKKRPKHRDGEIVEMV
jgi:transcriptional regulator with XRE-family HTH domain